jgi:hypothetical protein
MRIVESNGDLEVGRDRRAAACERISKSRGRNSWEVFLRD